jgi:MFS family permease
MSVDAMPFDNAEEATNHPTESWLSWVVCLTAGLFFFYEFIQMNMFNAISASFMQSFHISAHTMGSLDSFYFIANVIFLIPAGYLLDRFSIRHVILLSLFVCIIGTAGIAVANTMTLAMFFRFLTGIGSAFCFLSCIRLSTHWFHPKRIGLVIGIVLTEAMLGGYVSQRPLMALIQHTTWQHALLIDAIFGLFIWAIIYFVVQDAPAGHEPARLKPADRQAAIDSYKHGCRHAFGNLYNWLMGIYTSLLNFPLTVLGGLWGISYLTARFGLTQIAASDVTSMLFFGMMVGCPLAGYISDILKNRMTAMVSGSLILAAFVLAMLLIPGWTHLSLMVLFFAIGLFSGIQVMGYPAVAERARPEVLAMSVSVVNISVMSGEAIIKPLFGLFMDWHQQLTHHVGKALEFGDFRLAMWLLPPFIIIAIMSVFASQKK